MRACVAILLAAAFLGATAGLPARGAGEAPIAAVFYYPWYGTPARGGEWQHWQQNGGAPPRRIGSDFFPVRGPYASDDPQVLAAQMAEIARVGIAQVIVSWWGRDSLEDTRLPAVAAAARARGLGVAVHIEPYAGRTAASVGSDITYLRRLGVGDFYVYASPSVPDADWAALNAGLRGVRLFANTTLAGKAAAGGFAGLYTYDVLVYSGASFPRICRQAARLGLLCAPSVGPGYSARRATGDTRVRSRASGAVYDFMWSQALRAAAPVVTITSYNEWHEGTQIEPARARAGYESYDGAWGLRGARAESAYLDRTAYWTARLSRAPSPALGGTSR